MLKKGDRFGRLVVVKAIKKRSPSGRVRYWCTCDCGRKRVIVVGNDLVTGGTRSCGCLHREQSAVNLRKWAVSAEAKAVVAAFSEKRRGKGLGEFWSKVQVADLLSEKCSPHFGPCWLWKGQVDKDGYGKLKVDRTDFRATHIAWYLAAGDLPQGEACHVCDVPACVNPHHLFEGRAADNSYDRDLKKKGAKLIDAPTAEFVRKSERKERTCHTKN